MCVNAMRGENRQSEVESGEGRSSRDRSLIRPQTRLVRPTPNIKHPVIESTECTSQLSKERDDETEKTLEARNCGQSKLCSKQQSQQQQQRSIDKKSKKCTEDVHEQEDQVVRSAVKKYSIKKRSKELREQNHRHREMRQQESEKSSDRASLKSINTCQSPSWQKFTSSLASCEKCGRKFFPYRLSTHQRWCSGVKSVPVDAACQSTSQQILTSEVKEVNVSLQNVHLDMTDEEISQWHDHLSALKKCKTCSRSFFADRLATHQAICVRKTFDWNRRTRR